MPYYSGFITKSNTPEKNFGRIAFKNYFFGLRMKLMSLLGTLIVLTISMPSI